MRVSAGLVCTLIHVLTVKANVEKTVFLGPPTAALPNVDDLSKGINLDSFTIDVLDPLQSSLLATRLPVQFPSESALPRGLESWYILQALEEGRRYEVRICWPATQPTDFWLDTFTIPQLITSPDLVHALASYNTLHGETRTDLALDEVKRVSLQTSQPLLFLRIQAAASYFTTNQSLMRHPPPVDVDIILDPFLLNVLPQSLAPTVIYITLVSVFAWFVSGYIYRRLQSFAERLSKSHTD